ncbi:Leucine--tRNA ligase, mitochondrial [Candida viswanathii]|uniref:leucine--tRNA ligase n=1 Tax=Candida viswanathii TaxID=5486 RepID=A0A367XQ02_9ASCO|nr:Leucine--tRNA ligase, mitochondrial [Candida viswanathii]
MIRRTSLRTLLSALTHVKYSSTVSSKSIEFPKLDEKWKKLWKQQSPINSLHPVKHLIPPDAKTFYSLSMFPYPSGVLHLGHLRVYTISDVVARFKRMKGYNVIHPMGWDAFGLPAENAAVERNINPAEWTEMNIAKMKLQTEIFLADFDWDREVNTSAPEYYKWTQKIFLMLFEKGLAYRNYSEINWDPVDQTVLANEQVDAGGRSWRSGALVEKKFLKQWFIRITEYAKELNHDLKYLKDWPTKVKTMQKNWIGESTGTEIVIPVDSGFDHIKVFTSRPDTLFSLQFVALALNHPIVRQLAEEDPELAKFIEEAKNIDDPASKIGYKLKNVRASIPIDAHNKTQKKFDVPIYVAPYVLGSYGHGAVMGCPGHDERDFEFWKLHEPETPAVQIVAPKKSDNDSYPYVEKVGTLQDISVLPHGLKDIGEYKGKTVKEAMKLITVNLQKHGLGQSSTQFKIRDWLISRQRYWGAPIPIVHCDDCGPVAVPDEQLPVVLPKINGQHFGKGNPLEKIDEFVNTPCPSCGKPGKRETDTMDTFMDSSWYFFRYLDSKNDKALLGPKAAQNMPVDLYVGGVEHAILHLLYSRFVSKFLSDYGIWNGEPYHKEPFQKLVTQGMVHGKTFTDPANGRFLKPDEVDTKDPQNPIIKETGVTPNVSFEKMSKSKYNGVDPAECIGKYGADVVRAQMLFLAPVSDTLNWQEEQIAGTDRWLRRVIQLSDTIAEYPYKQTPTDEPHSFKDITLNGKTYNDIKFTSEELKLYNEVQGYVQSMTKSIEVDFSLNTVISDLMKITNAITNALKSPELYSRDLVLDCYKKLLVCMAPVTPASSEECWQRLAFSQGEAQPKSIFYETYPEGKPIESSFIPFNIFVNGRARGTIEADKSFITQSDADVVAKVSTIEPFSKLLNGGTFKKLIKKPGMISIVL